MKQIKRITLRLSLENPKDKEVADYLSNIDKNKYHTVNTAIKAILYSVISGADKNTAETIFKADMKDVIVVIRTTLEAEISKLLSVFSLRQHLTTPSKKHLKSN